MRNRVDASQAIADDEGVPSPVALELRLFNSGDQCVVGTVWHGQQVLLGPRESMHNALVRISHILDKQRAARAQPQ